MPHELGGTRQLRSLLDRPLRRSHLPEAYDCHVRRNFLAAQFLPLSEGQAINISYKAW